jgi:hypothetical protein
MPYILTLTREERKAIDSIGDRYAHGHKLYNLLWIECQASPADALWDDDSPITFRIPELAGWRIADIVVEDDLAGFGAELRAKLIALGDPVV